MRIAFDLNDLLAFRAVTELGSFRKAADSVHLSQPAFSRRIDKLERALGVRLLERTTRRVEPTAVGREFERKIRLLLDDLDETLLALRGVGAVRAGEVTVACVPSTVNYYLTHVLRRYRQRHPRVLVRILDGGADEVITAVARGDADFGIDFVGAQDAEIDFVPLVDDRFVLACRHDHPLARRRSVRWRELVAHEFVTLTRASGNRVLLDQALAGLPDRPKALCEARHVTAMLGLVEAGLGVAAVPRMAMPAADHPLLVSVPLLEPVVRRRVGLIRRRGRSLPPAALALFDLCVAMKPGGRRRGSAATRRKAAT